MSERPLPDDLTHWPEDPNQLLGVSFGVTPRELRRAYNRLIRIYKPEQFPEQFRRIREAYEYLLRIAEMFAPCAEVPDSPPAEELQLPPALKEPSSDDGDAERIAGNSQPAEEECATGQARRPKEELDELWAATIAGSPAGAYERLVQLTQQHAGRVELYLRLYWLLKLAPKLDGRRVAADWLVQGLLATGLAGPLRELYREEIADDPAEALSERYEQLLDAPNSTGLLADLVEWRFRAAVRLQRWDVLDADLTKLGPRFGVGEEQLWLRLLFSLADSVIWTTDPEGVRLLAACCAEIDHHEHFALTMAHLFDRLDLLMEASAGWRKLFHQSGTLAIIIWLLHTPVNAPLFGALRSRIPTAILQLIRDLWCRPFEEVRESLRSILEAIVVSPQKWLNYLDTMHQRAPALLALFGELLDRLEASTKGEMEQRDRDALTELVLPFLSRTNVVYYEKERKRLLLFCIQEAVTPEEIAEATSDAWKQALMDDWPLRYVCRACRLFWA